MNFKKAKFLSSSASAQNNKKVVKPIKAVQI